ncbi:carbon dioxide concentrating mechanism protein [Aerosakkonemataceae cyanobacterium BLCC-F50]|uniref:Carbon dioxide concentrating mechanism protein n=1 Tax=Floridaenema flaviceps BLCC-F50 TaxID=3153642 RepID=A0ABV4XVP1_9CYAN
MYSPPLQPLCNPQSYVSGDVTIDPSAVIGPGVLLAAEPNSRIVIAAGVCIGMGTIIHAQQGSLEVETGAVLGAGVLVVGAGKIGANACVGSCTTVLYSSIEPKQVISFGSLIGDKSRSTVDVTTIEVGAIDESPTPPEVKTDPKPESPVTPTPENHDLSVESEPLEPEKTTNNGQVSEATSPPQPQPQPQATQLEVEIPTNASVQVYGQLHLNRLLLTLFPHNQSFKPPDQDGKAE